MRKETRTAFINRVMGLDLGSIQGKYSFCNDERKQVLFSLDSKHGKDSTLILSKSWSPNGYAHSKKHILKVLNEGYDLLTYKTETQHKSGKTTVVSYDRLLEKRKLVTNDEEGEYWAKPIGLTLSEELHASGRELYEGAKKTITVNAYERNSEARQACIDAFGYACAVCGFDFESVYGERGSCFIHVHHIVPISETKSKYKINPTTDLVPVCPNCHSMLHRGGHTILPEELRKCMEK